MYLTTITFKPYGLLIYTLMYVRMAHVHASTDLSIMKSRHFSPHPHELDPTYIRNLPDVHKTETSNIRRIWMGE